MKTSKEILFDQIEIYINEKMSKKAKKKRNLILHFFKSPKEEFNHFLQNNFSNVFIKKHKIDLEKFLNEMIKLNSDKKEQRKKISHNFKKIF